MRRSSVAVSGMLLACVLVAGCQPAPQAVDPATEEAVDADAPVDTRAPDTGPGETDESTDATDTDASDTDASDAGADGAEGSDAGSADGSADADADDGSADADADDGSAEAEADDDADPATTVVCDASVVTAIDATVAGQLEAFAAGDYEAALGFASRAFRAGTDATAFRRLISTNYSTLTDDATHRSGVCQQAEAGGIALILIQVTGSDGTREDHVYVMVQEDDRWLIQGVGAPDGPDRLVA